MMNRRNLLRSHLSKLHPRKFFTTLISMGVAIGAASFLNIQSAEAAEKVVLTFGQLGRSITIEELEEFVATGKETATLDFLIDTFDLESEIVRQFLSQEIKISPKLLDNLLHTLPGEYALFEVGRIFHTPARRSNDKALRSSIILSTVDDNQLSVMEFLRKYPTPELFIDGLQASKAAGDIVPFINRVGDNLEGPIAFVSDVLDDFVCDCQAPQ